MGRWRQGIVDGTCSCPVRRQPLFVCQLVTAMQTSKILLSKIQYLYQAVLDIKFPFNFIIYRRYNTKFICLLLIHPSYCHLCFYIYLSISSLFMILHYVAVALRTMLLSKYAKMFLFLMQKLFLSFQDIQYGFWGWLHQLTSNHLSRSTVYTASWHIIR